MLNISPKKYRIAVCMSGELRSWRYCKESIKNFFNSLKPTVDGITYDVDVDYFCHTWLNGQRVYSNIDASELLYPVPDMVEEATEMINYYRPKLVRCEYRKSSFIYTNMRDLFDSMCQSIKLKRQYECEHGFEYDLVFKFRYDLHVLGVNHTDLNWKPNGRIVVDIADQNFITESNCHNFQDLLFYGDSFSFDKISNIYDWLVINHADGPVGFFERNTIDRIHNILGPGTILNYYTNKFQITTTTSRSIPYAVDSKRNSVVIVRPFTEVYDHCDPVERMRAFITQAKIHFPKKSINDVRGVIFDLDGVIVDTQHYHYQAFCKAFMELSGVDVSLDQITSPENSAQSSVKFHDLCAKYGVSIGYDEFLLKKDFYFIRLIEESLTIENEILEILDYLDSLKIKAVIASNSRMMNICAVLNKIGIKDRFHSLHSGYDSRRPKPFPDIIWDAIYSTGITNPWQEAHEFIFIDDTNSGIMAGVSSPVTTVKIASAKYLTMDFLRSIGK